MNRTLRTLMFADIFFMTGSGLFEPILAIFIKEDLIGGSIFMVGLASTLFFVTKAIVQLPFARYVDAHDNKVAYLLLGSLGIVAVPFMYMYASHIYTILGAQVLYGISAGLAYPSWLSLWSRHLDRDHEGFEWSIYSSFTGLGAALSAAIGAGVAQLVGFKATFLLVGIMSFLGWLVLLRLKLEGGGLGIKPRTYMKRKKLVHRF